MVIKFQSYFTRLWEEADCKTVNVHWLPLRENVNRHGMI